METIGKDFPVRANAFCLSSAKRASSAATSPAGTECFDIFSPEPGDRDVISQTDRLSSNETNIAARLVWIAVGASARSAAVGMVVSRMGGYNLTLPERRLLSTPHRIYLLSIVVFCNEVKGKSMLALSRDLGVQYKTAFVLAHKLREAMASALRGLTIGGEGKVAEIDGAYFGGHVRPENLATDRIDRRLAENQSGKRKVVVVMRERDGRTLPQVFASEDAAVSGLSEILCAGPG